MACHRGKGGVSQAQELACTELGSRNEARGAPEGWRSTGGAPEGWRDPAAGAAGRVRGGSRARPAPLQPFLAFPHPFSHKKWVDPTCSAAQENEALRGEGTTGSADRAETSEPQPRRGGGPGEPGSARPASCAGGTPWSRAGLPGQMFSICPLLLSRPLGDTGGPSLGGRLAGPVLGTRDIPATRSADLYPKSLLGP